MTVPDTSILTKAAVLSLAYGFIPKEQRENKVAARAYRAILVGYDDVVKGAVRLVPYTQHADGTVTFSPTKITRSYKVFDRIYPLKGDAVTYPELPSKCTWIEGDELANTMTDGDLIVGPSKPVPAAYTVERILNHSRFGDALGDIEYQCRYEGYDSTHDHYHQLSDLKKCKSLIDDYWKQQKDDSERRARIVSLAFASDAAAVENAIATAVDTVDTVDTQQDACVHCGDVHEPLCPDELCVGCCEMGGYECLSDAATDTVAGCTPLWEMERSTLTADQISDLATLEEDYFDAPSTEALEYEALHDIDSGSDGDDAKVVDETKGAQLQGGVVLTPTLCAADCMLSKIEAAPIISRKNPVMGLGSEHQAKLAFALLHNCDPTKVEINTLHRIGIKTYRTLFKMLTTDSPYDEQRWVEAVMAQRGPSPASDCAPFEATATPWQIVSQFDWASLDLPEPQIEVSNHFETSDFPANWHALSKLGSAELQHAEPTTVQGYACIDGTAIDATVPARANRSSVTSHRALPTGDEKRGEFSVEEACSDANLERFTKGLDRELGEMAKRRFVPDGEREITDNDMLHALACRLVITEKDDGAIKVRLVAKDLKCKRFVDTADSYAGVPAIKVVRMILAARAGDRISSADLITSYLQADDFEEGESLLLKFWHPLLKKWIYKWSRGWIYGCITAGAAWQKTYREWMLSIGFVECQNATSIYHHKQRDMIVSCFVDDPIMFAKTAADETWYHTALDARFDVKHHSYLSAAEPLTYCGTRISRDAAGQVCMDNAAFVEKMLLEWGLSWLQSSQSTNHQGHHDSLGRIDEAGALLWQRRVHRV